jgi:adenylate cyclase
VLEGSVRKAGGRVRITAQLIDGVSGNHVWAERYDRDLTDIFALQDEISEAICAALKLKLLPEEKEAIEKRGAASAEAYDLFLLARQIRYDSDWDPRRYEMIVRLCDRAIDIDPGYAHAWALKAFAQDALFRTAGRGEGGGAAGERALELDPNLADAHAVLARQLHSSGRVDEAFRELELALRLDPDSAEVNSRTGQTLYLERRFAEAVPYFEKAMALEERFIGPAMMLQATHAALGDAVAARRASEETLKRSQALLARDGSNGLAMASGVAALAHLGQAERAREWISRALLLEPDNANMRYNFACSLSRDLGDFDGALGLLSSALRDDHGGEILEAARTDPDFDRLRDDERFQALIAQAEAGLARAKATD